MNNLYDKIYEAINTGIQKALILDLDNDVSIKWYEKELTANVNIIGQLVNDLLNANKTDVPDIYHKIVDYHKNSNHKYKINTFNELADIYEKIYLFGDPDMSWINYTNIFNIILQNDTEIPIDLFNPDIHEAKFVKISNNGCGHDIIFHIDLLISKNGIPWIIDKNATVNFCNADCKTRGLYSDFGSSDKLASLLKNDYDGYKYTYHNADIIKNSRDINNYPALNYCMNLNKKYPGYECYLPAIGELKFIREHHYTQNIYIIGYLLNNIIGKKTFVNALYGEYLWTSSEYSKTQAWQSAMAEKPVKKTNSNGVYVFPLFKKI